MVILFLEDSIMTKKFNLNDYVKGSIGGNSPITLSNATAVRDYTVERPAQFTAPGYGITDWTRDAASAMWRGAQESDMKANQDEMADAQYAMDQVKNLFIALSAPEDSSEEIAEKESAKTEAIKNLRKAGIWSENRDPNISELNDIIKKQQKRYDENQEDYFYNKQEYDDSINNYDISQYYTGRSNEAVQTWGNWFYKMPATMGTSWSSPDKQVASFAGGWAGAKLGAAAGSFAGPIGAGIGALLGGIGGAQFLGGIDARKHESHMEAFMGYAEKVKELAKAKGVNVSAIADGVREQLNDRGVDTSNMSEDMLIEYALSDNSIQTGSEQFNKIAEDEFAASRRVYDRNNALGMGEIISDLSYILPIRSVGGQMLGKLLKPLTNALGKGTKKIVPNIIQDGLNMRFRKGLEIAAAGSVARNRALVKDVWEFTKDAMFRGVIEGTEEGAQAMIVDDYKAGEYDAETANDGFSDPTELQSWSDLAETIKLRTDALGAWMGLNDEYKDDQQMSEEMWSGFLLSLFNPQGLIVGVPKAASRLHELNKTPKVANYLQRSLEKQDNINARREFFKNLREGLPSGRNWNEALDLIGNELKSVRADGKTRNYNLDPLAITDGKTAPTNEDVDAFIQGQKKAANILNANYKTLREIFKKNKINVPDDDADLYAALAMDVQDDESLAKALLGSTSNAMSMMEASVFTSYEFRNKVDKLLKTSSDKTDESTMLIGRINSLNLALDYLAANTNGVSNKEQFKKLLKQNGFLSSTNALETAKITLANETVSKRLIEEKNKLTAQLKELHSDIDLDKIDNLSLLSDDAVLYQDSVKVANGVAKALIFEELIRNKKEEFFNPSQKFVEEKIAAYNDLLNRQSKLADNANAAARTGTEPTKVVSPAQEKLVDMTKEQIEQERIKTEASVAEQVAKLEEQLASIPEDSHLYSLVEHINKNAQFVKDNPLNYARYVSRLIKRMKWQYSNGEAAKEAPEDIKKKLEEIVSFANNLEAQVDNVVRLNTEARAKATRHNAGLRTTTANSRMWQDENGNKYTVSREDIEYSENEGAIITLRPAVREGLADEISKTMQQLRDKITEFNNDSVKNPDNKKENDKKVKAFEAVLQSLQEHENDIKSKRIVVNAEEARPWLEKLVTVNNLGETESFAEASDGLESIIKHVNDKIAQNKKHRNEKANSALANGDVFDYLTNDASNFEERKTLPKYKQKNVKWVRDEVRNIKSYALRNDDGINTALLNPHHVDKFWNGHFTMQYHNPKVIADKFGERAKFTREGVTYDRVKAASTYNFIGKLIAEAKASNKYKPEEVYEALEKLYNGSKEETILGQKVTSENYWNMIYATPFQQFLYSPRTGKMRLYLVVADYGSYDRLNKYSEEERQARAEFVHTMLNTFKKNDKKDDTDKEADQYLDISTEETEKEADYINRFYFNKEHVRVYPGDFNYAMETVKDDRSFLFKNEDGTVMNNSQVQELFDSKVPAAATAAKAHMADIIKVLGELNYVNVTEDKLNQTDESGKSNFYKLVEAVLKYGDGVLTAKSLATVLRDAVGELKEHSTVKKGAVTDRAKDLFKAFAEIIPEHFSSFKNPDTVSTLADFPVSETVKTSIKYKYFGNKTGIQIYSRDADVIDDTTKINITTNTEENIEKVTELFEYLQKELDKANTLKEFLDAINTNYRFVQSGQESHAISTLSEYFYAVKYGRFKNNGNIAMVFSKGAYLATDEKLSYESFNTKQVRKNNPLNKVNSLGLVKDEEGRYHFSIKEWVDNNVETSRTTPDGKKILTQMEIERNEALEPWKNMLSDAETLQESDDITLEQVESLFAKYEISAAEIIDEIRNDDFVGDKLKSGVTAKEVVDDLVYTLELRTKEYEESYQQKYSKQIEENVRKDASFEGLQHSYVHFAVGSFQTKDGVSIVYRDNQGNPHTVAGVNGTPGAVYMILPGFFSPSQEQQVVKLNPAHLSDEMADFVATMLNDVRTGKLKMDDAMTNVRVGKYVVKSDATVKTVLDQIVFNGTDAIVNNPGAEHNFAQFLHVDPQNTVHFGEQTLTDENFDQFVEFLKKKPRRIDMKKVTDINALNGVELNITTDENGETKTLLSRGRYDNYSSLVIEEGLVTSDLNARKGKGERVFAKPYVYTEFTPKNKLSKPVANSRKSEGSAANAKSNVEWQDANEIRKQVAEDVELEMIGSMDLQKAVKKLQSDFAAKLDSLAATGVVDTVGYNVNVYHSGKNFNMPLMKVSYVTVDADAGAGFAVVVNDPVQFQAVLVSLKNSGVDKIHFYISDENNKPIKQGDNRIGVWLNLEKITLPKQSTSEKNETLSASQSSDPNLLEIIKQQGEVLKEALNALKEIRGLGVSVPPAQSVSTPVAEQPTAPVNRTVSFDLFGDIPLKDLPTNLTHEQFIAEVENQVGEAIDDPAAYEEYKQQVDLLGTGFVGTGENTQKVAFNNGGGTSSPTEVVASELRRTEQPVQQPAQKAAESAASTVKIPTLAELITWIKGTDTAAYEGMKKQLNNTEADIYTSGVYLRYLSTHGMSISDATAYIKSKEGKDAIRIAKANYQSGVAHLTSLFNFESEHVEKEDYKEALKEVKRILGKVKIEELDVVSKEYDDAREANMYVYGACGESAIYIYKTMLDGREVIYKGGLYHEAFHKVSLFILSDKDRQKIYKQARLENPELANASDKMVEEWLADEFAARVLRWKNGEDKVYSKNFLVRQLQKLFNFIKKIGERFKTNHITDEYVDMNELFKNMYKGRYAFAKATAENKELFNKLYERRRAFGGVIVNNQIVAEDAKQYAQIKRHLIDRAISLSSLSQSSSGRVYVNMNTVKADLLKDINNQARDIALIEQNIANPQALPERLRQVDLFALLVAAARRKEVLENITQDGVWEEWVKNISQFVQQTFGIEQSDANDQLEGETHKGGIDNSTHRDSYGRNMFEELDINMKAMLWCVVDGDVKNPKNLKYTKDGLWVYAKIGQLYNKIVRYIVNSQSVEDMMKKLKDAAAIEIAENDDYTVQQFYAQLSNGDNALTIQMHKNQVYTAFVRHIHQFENYVYESEEHTFKDARTGKEVTTYTYEGSVRNGNTDTVSQNIKNVWKRNLVLGFSNIARRITAGNEKYLDVVEPLKDAVKTLRTAKKGSDAEVSAVENVLNKLSEIYAIEFKDGNIEKAARQIIKSKLTNLLMSFSTDLTLKMRENVIKELSAGSTGKSQFQREFQKLTAMDSSFFKLAQDLAQSQQPDAKDNSQRGPGNTKVYSIGAYNFITRLFSSRMKNPQWLDKLSRDIYTAGSSWLKELRKITPTVHTKFATMVDNDFGDASADIAVAPHEDMLNRLLAILNNEYNAPSLANKRFAASFEGFLFPERVQDVVRTDGVIQDAYIERYVNYLADEILAIAEAMKTREDFIKSVNEITGKDFTVESFSKWNSVQQENLFREYPALMPLILKLTKVKHFKEGGTVFTEVNGRTVRRVFHIDLRKGRGYEFRHFPNIGKKIKIDQELVDRLTENMGQSHDARQGAIQLAREIAGNYRDDVRKSINRNIVATLEAFMKEGLLEMQQGINPLTASVRIADLKNLMIPNNAFNKIAGLSADATAKVTGQLIFNMAAYYTIMDGIGLMEFEKLVTGDIAELKDITAVNKRYSGPCSTIDLTAEQGYFRNAFSEDRLMTSKTYNTLTINTSLVVNKEKFRSDLMNVLGVDIITGFKVKDGIVVPITDASKLLKDGEFIKPNAPLTKDYISHKKEGRSLGLKNNGEPLSNEELAERIVDNAVTRFLNYLNNDPTDAQVFISAEMFRQLMQRNGKWTRELEACYDLLENYDNILELEKSHPAELQQMAAVLGIKYDELLERARQYNRNPRKYGTYYKSWIIDKTALLDATSLKYVYFGEADEREDGSHTIIYDKMSLSPIFKIFADGHQMAEVYQLMKDRQIDMIKTESAVKMGGIASFELFDENGNINHKSLTYAPLQHQLFELLGKQLNTEPHEAGQSALLTQFMKIANMNIRPDDNYNVGDNSIKGSQIRELYGKIIDDLTNIGRRRFLLSFGLTENEDGSYSLDKKRFMEKLKSMGTTQDLPIDTLDAFDVDPATGNFIIHPSAMPNLRWIQSRLISEMGKKVIDTAAPGMPLYQVASVGYDDIFNLKTMADKHLRMPGENGSKHMEVKLSIKFFDDVLKKARGNKQLAAKYNGLKTFEDKRIFILNNQQLFALSYRVPTQGQNSTIPVKIVDVFPPQRGGIISFPAGVTAQTGSDFDIDKMFLARYNYTVEDGKLVKVQYDLQGYLEGKEQTLEQKQNMLLDIYFGVLTSPHHYLAANTPLDVCTAPLSNFAKSVANVGKVVKSLPAAPESDLMDTIHLVLNEHDKTFDAYVWNRATSSFDYQGTVPVTTAVYEEKLDMYYLNPTFQTAQKKKNAGSDAGIGPMALNSVFRYFAQVANLRMLPDEYLNSIGISRIDEIFDRNGDDILDITSALINAHVDAVKDNYIGNVNVNGYTFSTTAFMTSTGFGHDTFAFLTQPILKDLAETWSRKKKGIVVTDPSQARGQAFFREVQEKWQDRLDELKSDETVTLGKATAEEMTVTSLKLAAKNIDTAEGVAQQLRYLQTFEYLYNAASYYSDMINTAQIDTKKYGKSSDEIISFMQRVEQAHSPFNTVFENPSDVFDKTFLGTKWNQGVMMLMQAFDSTIFEFSTAYQNTANELSRQYGKYGRYSKEFMHRVGPRLRSVFHAPFFNQYLKERFPNNAKPLTKLFVGSTSVAARYEHIRNLAYQSGIGIDFFDLVKYNPMSKETLPQFFRISDDIKSDKNIENQLQASMSELFQSSNPEIRQWMNDFAVMMFYQTGGTDTNAGGIIKTTVYDIIPPQHLANIRTEAHGTYNDYVTNLINNNPRFSQEQLDQAMMLTALTDDSIVPTVDKTKVTTMISNKNGIADVIYVGYGSDKFKQRGQGTFNRFLKVRDSFGNTILYKLGNIMVVTNSEGRSYTNPVYFRVNTLGYRNRAMSAYSIRTDGEIVNGKVVSMFANTPSSEVTQFSDLSEADQKKFMTNKKLSKYTISNILPVTPVMDYGQYVNSDAALGDLRSLVAIDAANVIYYYNQGEDNDLKDYAEFKHNEYRQFIQITDPNDLSNVPVFENATVTLIGTLDPGIVDNLKSILPASNTYVDRGGNTISVSTPVQTAAKVQKSPYNYSRTVAKNNPKNLYIFTDNTDRTSYDRAATGKKASETKGWYYQKYGRDEHGSDTNPTTAVLRGLNNAAPISTMKWFYKAHPGETIDSSRWKDSDIEEFKNVINDEIEQIKELWRSGQFERIILPRGDGFFNSSIAKISPDSEIGKYLKYKLDELMDFVNNYKETPEEMSKEGEQRKKDCL